MFFSCLGMVMVSPDLNPQACWEFEGEILVLHHPTTISSRYQAMVHCGSIRQTASILNMSKECLRTGDKAQVRFRFIKHPEYIRPQQRMVFREGRTKAVGNVLRPLPTSVVTQGRAKPTKMQSRGQSHQHNQQNQNPNIQNECAQEEVLNGKADSVLDIGIDKRDFANHQRANAQRRPKRPIVKASTSAQPIQTISTKVQ